jgi:hypothetical protein
MHPLERRASAKSTGFNNPDRCRKINRLESNTIAKGLGWYYLDGLMDSDSLDILGYLVLATPKIDETGRKPHVVKIRYLVLELLDSDSHALAFALHRTL